MKGLDGVWPLKCAKKMWTLSLILFPFLASPQNVDLTLLNQVGFSDMQLHLSTMPSLRPEWILLATKSQMEAEIAKIHVFPDDLYPHYLHY